MAISCSECLLWVSVCLSVAAAAGGVTLLGVGVAALARDDWQLVQLLAAPLCPAVGAVLVTVGGLVTLLAALAACGARLEDRRLLQISFWLTLALLVAAGLALVVGFAMGAQTALQDVRGAMKNSIDRYDSDAEVRRQWDNMQDEYQCCGVDDATDWAVALGYSRVPTSCCRTDEVPLQRCNAFRGAYNVGCERQMSRVAERYSAVIGGTGAAVAVLMLLTMVASFALIKDSEDSHRYAALICPGGST